MSKISINLLGYNHRSTIGAAIESVLAQSFKDYEFIFTDNASSDGSAEFVRQKYPKVRIYQNPSNTGYAGGHNRFFESATSELVMVLNPDVVLEQDFLKNIVAIFDDAKVGAATGKMLRPGRSGLSPVLDGTGIVVTRSRRGRERGQMETDKGQYDDKKRVFGVSGTAAVYRRQALEQVAYTRPDGRKEFFDEDFFAYWEDLDLSWRLRLAGYECRFVPGARLQHERRASSSPGGYRKFFAFVRHHKDLPLSVRRWNWKNHLFCIVKNDFGWPLVRDLPLILMREIAMFFYILFFEPKTLGVVPDFFRQLPLMLKKRNFISSHRAVASNEVKKWFV